MIFSIILFFIIMLGLGFGTKYLLKLKFNNFFESLVMIIGIGLGTFALLGVTLNLINIPLHWGVFLIIALIGPVIWLIKDRKFKFNLESLDIRENWRFAVVLLMFIIYFWVMLSGALSYPYLEDDDPWSHALATKYVATEMTTDEPTYFDFHYLDPYPPSFDILMGVLHQTNNSIYLTLNLFNVLLMALGILFSYFFFKEFLKNDNKALFATFILFVLPSFMSHFIWAQTLAITLFFPAWYCMIKADEDKKGKGFSGLWSKWNIAASIIIASILVTQPSSAFVFIVMCGVYWIVKLFKKEYASIGPIIIGGLLSSIYWVPMIIRYGLRDMLVKIGLLKDYLTGANVDTSGGVVYKLMDFIVAPMSSRMDQPTGWGWIIFLLLIFSIVMIGLNYKKLKSKDYLIIAGIWLIFTLLGTQSNALPIKLLPHRFWAFMAIPLAVLVAEGFNIIERSVKDKLLKWIVIGIIVLGILWTSGIPKYTVETSAWPSGVEVYAPEATGLSWFQNVKGEKAFIMLKSSDAHAIGNDAISCSWCKEIVEFKKDLYNKSANEVYNFLSDNDYRYFAIGGFTFRSFGGDANSTQEYSSKMLGDIQAMVENGTLGVAYQSDYLAILELI